MASRCPIRRVPPRQRPDTREARRARREAAEEFLVGYLRRYPKLTPTVTHLARLPLILLLSAHARRKLFAAASRITGRKLVGRSKARHFEALVESREGEA